MRDELGSLDERAACDRISEIEGHVKRLVASGDKALLTLARKRLNDLNSRLVITAGKLLTEAEKDPKSAAEKAAASQKMINASKTLDVLLDQVVKAKG